MAWKHTSENKESRTQKDVNEYLKRKTGEQDKIVMKQQVAKKMSRSLPKKELSVLEKAYKRDFGRDMPEHLKQNKLYK